MNNAPVSTSETVLYDPQRLLDSLPLDREPHLLLAAAVLALPRKGSSLPPADCEQIGLQLAGHARVVADDVRVLYDRLPVRSTLRPLTNAVLSEAAGQLSVAPRPTVVSVQNRARLVCTLYRRLDELTSAIPPRPSP